MQQVATHGVEIKATERYVQFYRNEELIAVGSCTDGTYIMSMKVVISENKVK